MKSPRMPITFVLVITLLLCVPFAASQQKPPKNAPPKAAPAAKAPAPHGNAPTQHPNGNANAQHPGGANPHAAGANTANRNPNAGGPNHATGASANARSTTGANHSAQAGTHGPNGAAGTHANGAAGTHTAGAAGTHGAGAAGTHGNTSAAATKSRREPVGAKTVSLKSGGKATFRKDGHVRTVQTHGMTISHGMHGDRRIVATHNGRQVVVTGHGGGYSQRAYYRHGGNVYVQRTYYRDGHYYAYGYRSYYYGGYPYYGYAPAYYYGPAYYGWAYNPWPAPVYYNWGWAGQPWYGYYGPYYSPYPAYPYAALWLTDYLIAANLQAAYAAQQAASGRANPLSLGEDDGLLAMLWSSDELVSAHAPDALLAAALPAAPASAPMSPEVKQAIADQMKNEIAAEKEAAANKDKTTASGSEVPAALDPKIRYFVVSTNLDVTTSDGDECELTPGDVVYRTGDTADSDHMVDATVKAGKKDGCAVGATIAVDTSDLQEMHNNLRLNMDDGLKKLADNSGKNGLPTAPDTKTTTGEVPAPSPDTTVADDLKSAQKDADQAEAEVQQPN